MLDANGCAIGRGPFVANLIAHAPEDIAWLISRVESLEARDA